jgi:hypothetical protein
VSGCAADFDRVVRDALDPEKLARALTPRDRFMDRYVRATIRRLGEISPGAMVQLADGTRYDVKVPIELSAAASQASLALGYMALLRDFIFELESPDFQRLTLRGLIGPEVSPALFDTIIDLAEAAERDCRAHPL